MSIRRNAGGAPPALPPPNSKISGSSSRLAAAPDAEEDDMYMTMSAVPTRLATQPPTLPPRELTSSPTLSSSSSVSINSMGSTGGPSSQAAAAAAAAVSGSASSLPGSPLAAASSPIATATAAAATVADTPAKENGTAADKAGLPQVDVDEAPSQPPATKQASGLQRAPSSVVQPREATPGSFRVLTPASVSVTLKGHTQRLVAFTKHLQEFIHQIAFLQRHQAAQMKALSSQFKRKYDEKFQAFSTHAPQLDKLWQVAELSCSASADTLEFGAGDLLNVSESLQAFFVHNETLHNTILVNRRNAESALANEETSVKNVQRMYKEASERAEKAEKDDKKLIKLGPNKDKLLASRDLLHNEYVAHLAATRRHFEMYHTMALPQTLDAMEALHTILEFRAKDSLSAYAAITQKRQFELIAGFDELVERAEAYDAVRENEQFVASFGAIETGDVPVLSFVPFGEDDKEHILLSKFTADEIASRKIKLQDTISQTESDITKKTAAIQDKRHQKRELILKSKDSEAANLEVEVLAMQTELNNLKITHAKAQAQFTVYSSLDFSAVLRTPPQTRASMAQLPISTTSPAAAAGASPADAKPQLPQRNSSVLNSPASSRVAPGTVDAHETADGAAALGNARHKSFGSASGLSSLSNNSRASSSTSISQEESASASKDEYLDVDTLSPSAAAGQRKLPARPSNLPPIASGAATGGAPTSIPSRPQLPPLRTNSTVSPAAVKPAVTGKSLSAIDLGDYPEVNDLYVDNSTLSQFVPPTTGAATPAAAAAAATAAAAAAPTSGTGLNKKGTAMKNFLQSQLAADKTKEEGKPKDESDAKSLGKISTDSIVTVGYADLDHEYSMVTEDLMPRSKRETTQYATPLPLTTRAASPPPAAANSTPASRTPPSVPEPVASAPVAKTSQSDLPDSVRQQLENTKRTQKPNLAGINTAAAAVAAAPPAQPAEVTYQARMLFTYIAKNPDELTLRRGEVVEILEELPDGWNKGRANDRVGFFPANYASKLQ